MQNKKKIVTLYIKKDQINWAPVSQQTMNIREETNQKIRLLGNKFYLIKTLFDRMNLRRDDLFQVGMELENEFHDKKKVIHLQKQTKRMKDAIYAWYAENFFQEISDQHPIIMIKLNKISKKQYDSVYEKKIKNKQQTHITNSIELQTNIINEQNSINTDNINNFSVNAIQENQLKKCHQQNNIINQNSSKNIFNNIPLLNISQINQEIDDFEFSNIENEKNQSNHAQTNDSINFNFSNILNF